jgi:hypothetical protein
MLPLLAGQLLREAVVGLIDLQQTRNKDGPGARRPPAAIRCARHSVEQTLQRLVRVYGRLAGGPVDSMREGSWRSAITTPHRPGHRQPRCTSAGPACTHQRGRPVRARPSRALAPGQDPRPKYWEHYLEFYRVLTQGGTNGLPHQFTEMFQRAYSKAREELRNRRRGE